tara:strand:+ start:264 stop:566 length:303 start_codon:yes stop_codon:yes gene_type:complete
LEYAGASGKQMNHDLLSCWNLEKMTRKRLYFDKEDDIRRRDRKVFPTPPLALFSWLSSPGDFRTQCAAGNRTASPETTATPERHEAKIGRRQHRTTSLGK